MQYEPTLESLSQHEVPDWYHDAKLGIFIHWGLPSVPAWAPLTGELAEVAESIGWNAFFTKNPYVEWYLNSLRIKGSPTYRHHLETYGPDFSYDDFAPLFNKAVKRWNPGAWAAFFRQVGARYVVLVTKHHDGFLLWPSERSSPHKKDYKASRDIVDELADAVRAQGMRMGFYYSGGLDWSFNSKPIRSRDDMYGSIVQTPEFVEYVDTHWRELIDRYQTALLWNDIGYPTSAPVLELFAHYYNAIPDGVINDRFGQVTSSSGEAGEGVLENPGAVHCDFTTAEYASHDRIMAHKWEATRGIGFSFGYNRAEGPDSYLSAGEAIRLFVDIVSKNGNLLLNIGPMADGTIPELQRACLEGLGAWLDVNGEAIFGTRPWLTAEGGTAHGISIRYTRKDDNLYAILLDAPKAGPVAFQSLRAAKGTTIHLLGHEAPLSWRQDGDRLTVTPPQGIAEAPAYAFRITPQPQLLS